MERIYLDQNFWIGLTQARCGKPAGDRFRDLLVACERAADSGRFVFVLSMANYEENWRRTNARDRLDVATTMAGLSDFVNIAPVWRIIDWEIEASLRSCLALPGPSPMYSVFGRGVNELLRSDLVSLDQLSEQAQSAIRQQGAEDGVLNYLEFGALSGPPTSHHNVMDNRPGRDHQEKYVEVRRQLAESALELGGSRDAAVRLTLASDLVDMIPLITPIAERLGTSLSALTALGRGGLEVFLDGLPMGSIVSRLHMSAMRDGRAWTVNDYNDVLYLAAASAYCDLVGGERHWTSKLNQIKTTKRSTNLSSPEAMSGRSRAGWLNSV